MNKTRVLLASANKGKIRELNRLLAPLGTEIVGLDEFPEIGEIPETGSTFEENALLKARAGAKASGLICLADDSGLMVDALAGAPGVFSARFGDDEETRPGESRDRRNTRKLLRLMRGKSDRNCRFVTVMAVATPDGRELLARGEWPGLLLEEPRGENGFGYDPVFLDPETGLSAAQMSGEKKNGRSHRGRAARRLAELWPEFIRGQK